MSASQASEPWIYIRPGLAIDWKGYSIFERIPQAGNMSVNNEKNSRPEGTAEYQQHMQHMKTIPGDRTKSLRLVRQLGPRQVNGPIWLCETVDGLGQDIQVVLKLFSPKLHNNKPSLEECRARHDNRNPVALCPRPRVSGPRLGIPVCLTLKRYPFGAGWLPIVKLCPTPI